MYKWTMKTYDGNTQTWYTQQYVSLLKDALGEIRHMCEFSAGNTLDKQDILDVLDYVEANIDNEH